MIAARRCWAATATAALATGAFAAPATQPTAPGSTASAPVPATLPGSVAARADLRRFAWLARRARYRTAAYVLCETPGEGPGSAASQSAGPGFSEQPAEGR